LFLEISLNTCTAPLNNYKIYHFSAILSTKKNKNKNLIEDPTKQIPGFDLPRKIWCKLNRFRTGHGKCNNMLFHWNIRENPSCECGAEKETVQHIVEECPLTKFQQGFSKLHVLTEDALNWLQQIKNI
jgi:hypothetical protein